MVEPKLSKITAEVKRARSLWLQSPRAVNKMNLNRLEALKKKVILKEKRHSWDTSTKSLDPKTSCKKIKDFANNMSGSSKRSKQFEYLIIDEANNRITNENTISNLFLKQFNPTQNSTFNSEQDTLGDELEEDIK